MNKFVIAAAAILGALLLGLAVYWVVGDIDLRGRSSGPGGGPDAQGGTAAPAALSPAEAETIRAGLEQANQAQVTQNARAVLAGDAERPWKPDKSAEAFRSCMSRLPGTGLFPDEDAARQERVCLCVAQRLQKAFPAAPPAGKKAARSLSRAEIDAIEACVGQAR